MESLGASLQPYSQHLQQLVVVLTCVKLLRIFKIMLLLRRETCSDSFPLKSLLGALIHAVLDMRMAQLTGEAIMIKISTSSLILNVTLLALLYCYASPEHKSRILRKMLVIVMLLVLCFCYSIIDDPTTVLCFLSIWRTLTTCLLIVIGFLQATDAALGCIMSTLLATSKLLFALSTVNNNNSNNTFMVYQSLFVLTLNLLRILSIVVRSPRLPGILSKPSIVEHSSTVFNGIRGSSILGLRSRSTIGQDELSTVNRRNLSTTSQAT
ncbi:hypothetical protein ACLKA7_007560 [Drosophila subpalustris]